MECRLGLTESDEQLVRPDVASRTDADGDSPLEHRSQPAAGVVLHAHHMGAGSAVEEPLLDREVLLHVGVEVEMVLGEVREGTDRESDVVGSMKRQGVRGDLHRHQLDPGVGHLPKQPLQVAGLWGGVGQRDG